MFFQIHDIEDSEHRADVRLPGAPQHCTVYSNWALLAPTHHALGWGPITVFTLSEVGETLHWEIFSPLSLSGRRIIRSAAMHF
jgi:hypothetical protein